MINQLINKKSPIYFLRLSLSTALVFMVMSFATIKYTLAEQVYIYPDYTDKRFPQSNKFHAGCENDFYMALDSIDGVKSINIDLSYDADKIEILRFVPDTNFIEEKADYKITHDQIHFSKHNQGNFLKNDKLFKIRFKSNEKLTSTSMKIMSGSYITMTGNEKKFLGGNFMFEFIKVPECMPDVVPPSIRLINPKSTKETLPLDSYFIFEVKDNDKGVDQEHVTINFDGVIYDSKSDYITRSGDNLTFYPANWLSVNKNLNLRITIQDLQEYGGANITEEIYSFKSTAEAIFINYIDPSRLRNLAIKPDEKELLNRCELFKDVYLRSEASLRLKIRSLFNKDITTIGCVLPNDQEVSQYVKDSTNRQTSDMLECIDSDNEARLVFENKLQSALILVAVVLCVFVITLFVAVYNIKKYRKIKKEYQQLLDKINNPPIL